MVLNRLEEKGAGLYITSRKKFIPVGKFRGSTIEAVFKFAYKMSFGIGGEHRSHRSGGTIKRKNGQIFANAFQGKLSEFAVYNSLYKDYKITPPDMSTYDLGKWDSYDFEINSKKISVKSTKSFGNLMLLETKDWNLKGQYVPNLSKGQGNYDIFILVRIEPYCEDLLKEIRGLFSNEVNEKELFEKIRNKEWKYDIPGFITNSDLIFAINNNHIIKKGQLLNGTTKMDADNYYIQSGNMLDIKVLKKYLNDDGDYEN